VGALDEVEKEKQAAAEGAAALVEDGMLVGLGTGSTVAYLLPALGKRRLDISCVATSPATEALARAEGLRVGPFEHIDRLDMAIDGADQVDPRGWLVKGGGGAHTREKIVAMAADRFIVIVSSNKLVPLPDVAVRPGPNSPDGGVLADYHGAGAGTLGDLAQLAARFAATPGVVEHGLFPPSMVSLVVVGRGAGVETFPPAG
jgi:ribose 5-phosphate isomerase A